MIKGQKLPRSKVALIKLELDSFELNQSICRIKLMKKHYIVDGSLLDEFNDNNFRVVLTAVRKLMPEKKFETIDKMITRTK